MRSKRWALGSGAVFGITVAMVLVVPFTRRHILGTLRGEPLQNGKYMGEWTEELADEDKTRETESTRSRRTRPIA